MRALQFKEGKYLGSFLNEKIPTEFRSPEGKILPEIAFIGKSNAGKSSLLNHLFNQKLAFVSNQPGKTQTLNFFSIDHLFCAVDLPGYGFAKVSANLKKKWAQFLPLYLNERKQLKMLFLLMDARRLPSEEDIALLQLAEHHQKLLFFIMTKCDKLNAEEFKKQMLAIKNSLNKYWNERFCIFHTHSIKEPKCKKVLIAQVNQKIREYKLWD